MSLPLIVIDGPAGVGKTSTSRAVSKQLGIPFLDTGAMYRAVTVAVKKRGLNSQDAAAMKRLLDSTDFKFAPGINGIQVWINDEDVTSELRTPETTKAVSNVCEVSEVRTFLVSLQRQWAGRGFGVAEGRDLGTVVFPKAGLKIFLTARPQVRALRRGQDLGIGDDSQALQKLAQELEARDHRDTSRDDSPLEQAQDAIVVDTSDLTFDEQVQKIIKLAADRFNMKTYGIN